MIALLLIWMLLAPAAVGLFCALVGIPVGPAAMMAVIVCGMIAWLGVVVVERT